MTEETTPPTPDEVDEFLDGVENWHDSMPFYNDDLGALLKEFRRLREEAPKMRARRDAALRERDALAQQLHGAVTQRDQAQAGAHFAVDAGARYLQELQKLEETVKGLRERNEILAAAYERDTEALSAIRKVVFEDTALHHEQRMGRIASALVKMEAGL